MITVFFHNEINSIEYLRHNSCRPYFIVPVFKYGQALYLWIFNPSDSEGLNLMKDKCYGGIPTSSQYHPFITNILSLLVSLSAIVFSTFVKLNILYLHDKIKTFFCIYFDLLISLILNLYKIRSNQMHTVIRTHIYFRRNSH
jgi:hypothetical protein